MLSAILSGVASGVAGSLLGGGDSGGGYQMTETENLLQGKINGYLENGMPQYDGQTSVETPDYMQGLIDTATSQLNGENLGMSDQEMNQMWNKSKEKLNEQRTEGVSNTISNMNKRGILSSDITSQGLQQVEKDYSQAASNALRDIDLANENVKRQQQQQAMGTLFNLGQYQTGVDQWNTQNQQNSFYRQQQLNQMPLQMGMNYLSGVVMPRQRGQANADAQRDAGMWGGLGSLVGTALPMLMGGGGS